MHVVVMYVYTEFPRAHLRCLQAIEPAEHSNDNRHPRHVLGWGAGSYRQWCVSLWGGRGRRANLQIACHVAHGLMDNPSKEVMIDLPGVNNNPRVSSVWRCRVGSALC